MAAVIPTSPLWFVEVGRRAERRGQTAGEELMWGNFGVWKRARMKIF